MAQTHKLNIQEIQMQQVKILPRSPTEMCEWAECSGAGTGTKTTADPDCWGSNTTTSTQLWDRYFSPTYQETISRRLDTDMTRQEKPNLSWPPSAPGWMSWLSRARTLQQDLTESKMQFRGLWKMNKFELNQHMAFIRWRNGYELQSRLPRAHSYSLWSLEFHSNFGAQTVKAICSEGYTQGDTEREMW